MELLNIDKKMLREELDKNGIRSARDVFYCYVNAVSYTHLLSASFRAMLRILFFLFSRLEKLCSTK